MKKRCVAMLMAAVMSVTSILPANVSVYADEYVSEAMILDTVTGDSEESEQELEIGTLSLVDEGITSGTLGDNNGFQWTYDESTKTLTVTGEDSGLRGGAVSPFFNICNKVVHVIFRDCKLIGSASYLFGHLYYIEDIQFINCDTSEVTDMGHMFYACRNLKSLDLSGFDTSKVTDMGGMFYDCRSLESLDLSSFDTSKVTYIRLMFGYCSNLKSVNVSSFDMSSVTDIRAMFFECDSLEHLDLSCFNTSNTIHMDDIFEGCDSLKILNLRGFNTGASDITRMINVLKDCNNLSIIYTPAYMGEGHAIYLPDTFYDTQMNEVTKLTAGNCNTTLVRDAEKYRNGFSVKEDAWSFRNNHDGFGYIKPYYIPKERYEKVFGSNYVAVAQAGDEKTFNSMMPEWNGSCYGMSATAILFYLGMLDWSQYAALYENDFSTVNSYYEKIKYISNLAYACSEFGTEVTELIECYHIFQYGTKRGYKYGETSTFNDIKIDYWKNGNPNEHDMQGKYILDVYEKIISADEPLMVGLVGNKFGHAVVVRSDRMPIYVDGWYRIYIYDPNHPYIKKENVGEFLLKDYYLNNYSADTYIELNIKENKWRFYGGLNGDSKEIYCGCDKNSNIQYILNEDGAKREVEYMYVFALSNIGYPTEFNYSNNKEWLPPDDGTSAISTTANSNFLAYATDGTKLLEIVNGTPVMLADNIEFYPYTGYIADGDSSCGGKIEMPYTEFNIEYISGDDISIMDYDSVINVACDGASNISISMEENVIDIYSKNENEMLTQITDLSTESGYTSVYVDGILDSGDEIALSLIEDNCKVAGSMTGNSSLKLYTDNNKNTEEKHVTTLSASNQEIEISDVRNIISVSDIIIFPTEKTLTTKNETFEIQATIQPENASNKGVTFESSSEEVAIVDKLTGVVTAVGNGTAEITATTDDGNKIASCQVTVNIPYSVTLPEIQNGYSLTTDAVEVLQNGTVTIAFELLEGYSKTEMFAVKVNGSKVALNDDGTYVISNVNEDIEITVEGVADISMPGLEITVKENKWNSFLNVITFGLFFKEIQSITINAADVNTGSGIEKVYYYVSNEQKSLDEIKAISSWMEYTTEINIESDNKYVIYAKTVDSAGNTTYVCSEGIVLDKTAPVISNIENNTTYYGDITFNVSDTYLEKVFVDNAEVTLKDGSYTILADSQEHIIKAIDKARNETVVVIKVNEIVEKEFLEIENTVSGYKGVYDGEAHGINITVYNPEDTKITYGTDGINYSETNPEFTDRGSYMVYYKLEKEGYITVTGEATVEITSKEVEVFAGDQNIQHGEDIEQSKYIICGLLKGDNVTDIKLLPSTLNVTDNGVITIDSIKIKNTENKDVTENYKIRYISGKLIIVEKTPVEYTILEGEDSTWDSSQDGLTIRGDGDFEKFTGIKINSTIVPEECYQAKAGSTIVTIKASYLETLAAGSHIVELIWIDGSVKTIFHILEKILPPSTEEKNNGSEDVLLKPDDMETEVNDEYKKEETEDMEAMVEVLVPETGDESSLVLDMFILLMTIMGLAQLYAKKKKY